jgi:hypothetical protein
MVRSRSPPQGETAKSFTCKVAYEVTHLCWVAVTRSLAGCSKDFEYEAYRFEQERDEAKAMLAKGRFVLHETVGSRALAIRVMEDALCGGYANEVRWSGALNRIIMRIQAA